jgi:uncharacterized repeat protein (TIGR04138 family)
MPSTSADVWSQPYPPEAFDFVADGLTHTVQRIHRGSGSDDPDSEEGRHVDGRELSDGLRDFAIRRFGFMAPAVLGRWNSHRTDDFGRIVYALIEMQRLRKSDRDRLEDFFSVYDFTTAFSDRAIIDALALIRDEDSAG